MPAWQGIVFSPAVSSRSASVPVSNSVLVQVNAVLGPATRTHTIYEHIEVVVHPLGVHLTEAVATPFWVGDCTQLPVQLAWLSEYWRMRSLHEQLLTHTSMHWAGL